MFAIFHNISEKAQYHSEAVVLILHFSWQLVWVWSHLACLFAQGCLNITCATAKAPAGSGAGTFRMGFDVTDNYKPLMCAPLECVWFFQWFFGGGGCHCLFLTSLWLTRPTNADVIFHVLMFILWNLYIVSCILNSTLLLAVHQCKKCLIKRYSNFTNIFYFPTRHF